MLLDEIGKGIGQAGDANAYENMLTLFEATGTLLNDEIKSAIASIAENADRAGDEWT